MPNSSHNRKNIEIANAAARSSVGAVGGFWRRLCLLFWWTWNGFLCRAHIEQLACMQSARVSGDDEMDSFVMGVLVGHVDFDDLSSRFLLWVAARRVGLQQKGKYA